METESTKEKQSQSEFLKRRAGHELFSIFLSLVPRKRIELHHLNVNNQGKTRCLFLKTPQDILIYLMLENRSRVLILFVLLVPCPTLPQATLQQQDIAREFNHGSVKPSLLEAVSLLLLFIFLMDLSRSAAGAGFHHQHPSCCASPPANRSMKRPSSFNYRQCYSPITVFLPFYSSFCPPSHKGRT